MNILFTVCGRAGSKGCKNKNIREFLGKPLFMQTINIIRLFKKTTDHKIEVAISTDSPEFISLAENHCPEVFVINRSSDLAQDTTPKVPVIQNAMNLSEEHFGLKFDIVIDLDITSPIRTINDINNAINESIKTNSDCVFSVVPARRNPYFNMVTKKENGYNRVIDSNFTSRQQAPEIYDMNASIYAYKPSFLQKENLKSPLEGTSSIIVMRETGIIDIDNAEDFELMELMAKYLSSQYPEYKELFEC